MKRHYARFVAAGLILSGMVAACTGDLLQADHETSSNPYLPKAERFVAGLVDHAIDHAESYQGERKDPGLILLESLDSYEGIKADIAVEELNWTLLEVREAGRAGKSSREPFRGDPSLDDNQKRYMHRVLAEAEDIQSAQQLAARMSVVEAAAQKELGDVAARPILVLAATLQANYNFFTEPEGIAKVARLLDALDVAAGEPASVRKPHLLAIQEAPTRPPPSFGDYWNPGTWWSETLQDTRESAELGVLTGAGIGCAAGLMGAVAGCAAGAGAGGFLGGLLGTIVGGSISAIANISESRQNYQQAQSGWCREQETLNFNLRHWDYGARCGSDTPE